MLNFQRTCFVNPSRGHLKISFLWFGGLRGAELGISVTQSHLLSTTARLIHVAVSSACIALILYSCRISLQKFMNRRLRRMVTHDGKMATDVNFQQIMEDAKKQTADTPPDTKSKKVKHAVSEPCLNEVFMKKGAG